MIFDIKGEADNAGSAPSSAVAPPTQNMDYFDYQPVSMVSTKFSRQPMTCQLMNDIQTQTFVGQTDHLCL